MELEKKIKILEEMVEGLSKKLSTEKKRNEKLSSKVESLLEKLSMENMEKIVELEGFIKTQKERIISLETENYFLTHSKSEREVILENEIKRLISDKALEKKEEKKVVKEFIVQDNGWTMLRNIVNKLIPGNEIIISGNSIFEKHISGIINKIGNVKENNVVEIIGKSNFYTEETNFQIEPTAELITLTVDGKEYRTAIEIWPEEKKRKK